MSTPLLIDSTIWIDWLRRRVDPRPLVKPWLLQRRCFTCGIIRTEVLRGIISAAQRERVEMLFDLMENIPLDGQFWREIARFAWELDRAGRVLPLGDIIIGLCAKNTGAWIVTNDTHFEDIPGLRVRREIPREIGE